METTHLSFLTISKTVKESTRKINTSISQSEDKVRRTKQLRAKKVLINKIKFFENYFLSFGKSNGSKTKGTDGREGSRT